MSQSPSDQYTEKYEQHEVVQMFFEKRLQTWKGLSEYIFFGNSKKKKIAYKKCDEIEYAVSIDID
jgi:hypothetical protein